MSRFSKLKESIRAFRRTALPMAKAAAVVMVSLSTAILGLFLFTYCREAILENRTFFLSLSVVLLWLCTGKDPLYWLIKLLIAFRAVLAVLIRMSKEAITVFREYFPDSFEQGKKEVGA